MVIIKQGMKKKQPFRGECSSCGCIFECPEEELTHVVGDQRDGRYAPVVCPQCGHGAVMWPKKEDQ